MIHPTAVVADGASIGDNVEIGPYAIIEDDAIIGDNCSIAAHAVVMKYSEIGQNSTIHHGAVIGNTPQDNHFGGEQSYVKIGSNCIIREYVTIHRGTEPESVTSVGNNVMLMALSHLAHNVTLADGATITNSSLLGGYVYVGEGAFISGGVMIHQFVQVGRLAMVGGGSLVTQDIPPFCMLQFGDIRGVNSVGLKRSGMSPDKRQDVRRAYKTFFREGLNSGEAITKIRESMPDSPVAEEFAGFVEGTKRGIQGGESRHNKSKAQI